MPDIVPIPQIDLAILEDEAVKELIAVLDEKKALALVLGTFSEYESARSSNQEHRWTRADELVSGVKPILKWEGTNKPRANHSIRLAYNKIEETYPIIVQSLFGPDGEWFDITAEQGASPSDAAMMKARLNYILDHNQDNTGLSAITDICEAIKSILTYGNGGIKIEWNPLLKKPEVIFKPLVDIYFDPGNTTHSVDGCRSIIERCLKPISEVQLWRGVEGINIPDDDLLYSLSQSHFATNGDTVRNNQSALYGEVWSQASNVTAPNPANNLLELLYYYSKSQIIIVAGRQHVIYSGPNPYGFMPFAFAHYTSTIGRFYSMGIPDVIAGEQRISEQIINKHLDELSLALNPPQARKVGDRTQGKSSWAPGMQFISENPKDDIAVLAGKPVTTDVWRDLEYFETLTDKRTGKPSMNSPKGGNINRTLGGVQAQVSGGLSRLFMVIKQIEDYMIIPMLCKIQKMLQVHENPGDVSQGRMNGSYTGVDTNSYYKKYSYRVKAASNMLSREKMMPLLPVIFQSFGNGPLVQGLAASGMTVNWSEVFRFLKEATGLGDKFELVRQMSPEEQQKLNEPPPQVVMEAQRAEKEQQTKVQIEQMKIQGDLQKESIKKQPDPMEMQREAMKMQFEQEKAKLQIQIEQTKMALEAQKAEMNLRIKEIESRFKEQELARKSQFDAAKQEQDFMNQARQSSLEQERMEAEHQQTIRMNEEKERSFSESNKMKLEQQKMKLKTGVPRSNGK